MGRAGFKAHQKLNKSAWFSKPSANFDDDKSSAYQRFGKRDEDARRLLTAPLGPAAWVWAAVLLLGLAGLIVVLLCRAIENAVQGVLP